MELNKLRVPLYDRLPEIYKIEDEKQRPPGQLRAYLALVEEVYGAIHANIEALYDDLFIETCADWVIPYLADLLGTSHLSGDPWTLRADVADTIALRRRKGTLASIERLTYNLTRWGVHAVELRERLVWNQHLNHQRPDAGGQPPYSLPSVTRFTPIRGGTVALRDPALLSLLSTPFDPFAHVADVKPPVFGSIHHNLPNLALFLWRLEDYRVQASRPIFEPTVADGTLRLVRFHVHPIGQPVRLFNTYQFDPDLDPPVVTALDATPGPIHPARLNEDAEAGQPESYFAVDVYDPSDPTTAARDIADAGLQLHLPEAEFSGQLWEADGVRAWTVRGDNLCAWESRVQPPTQAGDIVIDPIVGRIIIGVAGPDAATADALAAALEDHLLVTYTYGAVGPVGAHPHTRERLPAPWTDPGVIRREVNLHADPSFTLQDALANLHTVTEPVIIDIQDSLTHVLDLGAVAGTIPEGGAANLRLSTPLLLRAADGQRPVIALQNPLRFRPADPSEADDLTVRLEGLYFTRGDAFPADAPPTYAPLIARAALHRLELVACTLDPGGNKVLDGTPAGGRAPIRRALQLHEPYGFDAATDEDAFDQTPEISLRNTIAGPLFIDRGYRLWLTHTIVDAGQGVGDVLGAPADEQFAVTNATDPTDAYGPVTQVQGLTVWGRMRVEQLNGKGGIWVHRLNVLNNQTGCLKFSYFEGVDDRLPQNLGCVRGTDGVLLRFVSELFGEPGYAQLTLATDPSIRENGPQSNEMGAFGFLQEAHKWRNLQIRFREFMPIGVRPLLIPVT